MNAIKMKRIYDDYSEEDGYRILVDRLWPRGFTKERAQIDEWAKVIAPSSEIRKEFHHDPSKMDEFRLKYRIELEQNRQAKEYADHISELLKDRNVTFLYAAKHREINHAVILKGWIEKNITEDKEHS